MAIKLSDLLKMPRSEVFAKLSLSNPKCVSCGREIKSTRGLRFIAIKKGFECEDCYWDALGDLVEENPICNPIGAIGYGLNKQQQAEARRLIDWQNDSLHSDYTLGGPFNEYN